MRRLLMLFVLLAMLARRGSATTTTTSAEDARVSELIEEWAPLVWLAPGERFLPLGVPEFLDNVQVNDNYMRTRLTLQSLLQNRSSFLHGRKPAGSVPIYALVKNCMKKAAVDESPLPPGDVLQDEIAIKPVESNNVPGSHDSSEYSLELPAGPKSRRFSRSRSFPEKSGKSYGEPEDRGGGGPKRRKPSYRSKKPRRPLHFHVTYWMFYPFSEGKAVCVLDLGFLGSWPIPSLGGMCLGRLREYGSHVGDWEHVSLYFKGKDYPIAMYVSAHDAGAFYRYEPRSGTFVYESQETRKGIFQKPIFPERVHTSSGSHPILFSARGSHGLWTAPGKHKFVRLPRLYDESGFGTAWPTWRKIEMLTGQIMPAWMSFTGKWGNPKSNCHPLARLGFNICEFVDGPTGIPMKKMNFRC